MQVAGASSNQMKENLGGRWSKVVVIAFVLPGDVDDHTVPSGGNARVKRARLSLLV